MGPELSEQLLVQRMRAKDQSAWYELHDRYERRLSSFVRRRLHDHSYVEEVVQDTFIAFEKTLANYDETLRLESWLFTIASHKLTDRFRQITRKLRREAGHRLGSVDEPIDVKQRPASSLARSAERHEKEKEALAAALRKIIRDWRDRGLYGQIMAAELMFVKGLSNKEVAALVELTDQQVANLKHHIKKLLKEYLRSAELSVDIFPELKD